jgi:hypothetical protein
MSGVIALADVVPGMGALSVLSLKKNNLCNREAGKALSEMLVVNTVLTELDVSENTYYMCDSAGFVQELAVGIIDNGAMTSLHIGQNNIPENEMREIMAIAMRMDSMKILCEIPFKDKTLTELDVSGKNLGTEGALVVAEYFDGNGAISHFTFCGDSRDSKPVTMETAMVEANFSGKHLGLSGAIMLSAFLPKCT